MAWSMPPCMCWLNACRAELVKLQAGDPANVELWRQFVSLSLQEFDKIYRRLDIHFDFVRGESFYNDRLKAVVYGQSRATRAPRRRSSPGHTLRCVVTGSVCSAAFTASTGSTTRKPL